MPRACPVEFHACYYVTEQSHYLDAPGLSRGVSRLLLRNRVITLAGCHGLVPWRFTCGANVAANVRLHGTSPWHLDICVLIFISCQREVPRDKPVASGYLRFDLC